MTKPVPPSRGLPESDQETGARRPVAGGALRRVARLLGRSVSAPLDRYAPLAGPIPGLMRRDGHALRQYMRHALAVQQSMGEQVARRYGRLVAAAAEIDGALAGGLAADVPVHLARNQPDQRLRYLDMMHMVLEERPDAALPLADSLPDLLPRLDDATLRRFIRQGLSLLGESQQRAVSFLKAESEEGRVTLERMKPGVPLRDVSRVLALYARAHCGEDVQVVGAGVEGATGHAAPGSSPLQSGQAGVAFTDGHRIVLPEHLDVFGDEKDFLLYRVITAHTVGYLEFGTFDLLLDDLPGQWPAPREGESELQRLFRAFPNHSLARDLFQLLEDGRVEGCLGRGYPGLRRDMLLIRSHMPHYRPLLDGLSPVQQVLEWVARDAWEFQGLRQNETSPASEVEAIGQRVAAVRRQLLQEDGGVERSVAALQETYRQVEGLMRRVEDGAGHSRGAGEALRRRWRRRGAADVDGQQQAEGGPPSYRPLLTQGMLRPEARDDRARALDDRAYRVLRQLRERGEEAVLSRVRGELKRKHRAADYEEMDRWLETLEGPAGGRVDPGRSPDPRDELPTVLGEGVEPGGLADARSFVYPEWNLHIDDHQPGWVRLREYPLAVGSRRFVEQTISRYGPLIRSLRRQFEALRPAEMSVVRGQPDGDSLDMDRVVEAYTARRGGGSPPENLYIRHVRDRRDVAVAFLLDLSSSTNEVAGQEGKRIIQIEKEALVLIAEALDALGDAFAIYGFSGYGRQQVAFYIAKEFTEPYGDSVRERIGRLNWKMENRDGAAIRHATHKLMGRPARVRLLILLSDGKPLDCGCDHYSDRYAQEDTRMALREARKQGVHPFCITVDPTGRQYLEHMYGRNAYTIIERVEALPARIPTIYRRLTR